MTIVASVKVRDGLILATDSMSHTVQSAPDGGHQFLKAWENARKLFQVASLPIGVMTYGLGNVGERSVEGLVLDFEDRLGGRKSVADVASGLYAFVRNHYDPVVAGETDDQKPSLGFVVAGYSPKQPFPEAMEFLLPNDDVGPSVMAERTSTGAAWRGIDVPFTRLWKGFDPQLVYLLRRRGIADQEVEDLLVGLEQAVTYSGMPVQDAINFATYILRTTIGYSEFSVGVPACGGPLQVATILPDSGFVWVSKPELHVSPA